MDAVLQGVIDSARSLAGAGYGRISTMDVAGTSCSSGMTPEEHERLAETPDGSMFPQYRLGLSGPLRIPDMVCHFRSLGLSEFQPPVPAKSFLATSLRNRSLTWGVIYLAKGEGGPGFTAEDAFCHTGEIALRK